MLVRNSALTRAILDRAGSDANALMAAPVAVGDAVVGQLIRVSAALYIDTAKGADLDRLAFDRYRLLRKDASPAVGEVRLGLAVAAVSSFLVPAGTNFKTTDNKQFTSTADRTFPAGATTLTVPVASVLAGASQQARAGTITSIVSAISGAPAGLTVINALATAGADDAELDEDFRARCKLFYRTAARGTIPAIETLGLSVAGVRRATAFEVIDPDGEPARIVEIVVADAFTQQLINALVLPISYSTQSQQLAAAVVAALRETRAAGIQVIVTVANVVLVGITLGLRFRAGVDVEATSAAARAAAVSYVNGLRPGATLVISALEQALAGVPGLQVLGGEVLSPTLDLTALPATVLRTSEGLVTVSTQS